MNQNKHKKIAVIGAGLAGLTAAYRLHKKGFDVQVYEARNRVGGRVISALINGHIAELGGENIADGGFEYIGPLIEECGLELIHSESLFNRFLYQNNKLLSFNELIEQHNLDLKELKKRLYALKQHYASMKEVLDQLFASNDPLKTLLSTSLAGYEGAPVDQLSSLYVDTLYYKIQGGICKAHQDIRTTQYAAIKEGNSRLPQALSAKLGERVHLEMPVTLIKKNKQNQYDLTFNNGSNVTADILVLALPCPVYQDIIFDEKVISSERLTAIRSVKNGQNAKIMVPVSGDFSTSIILLNDHMAIYTYVEKMITLIFTGQSSLFGPDTIAKRYAQERPMLTYGFKPESLPQQEPVIARDELFARYSGPVGYSWPNDPFAKGSYAYIGVGQEELLTKTENHDDFVVKTLFAPIDHQLYFAGEHTSTLSDTPGSMEAACQSGSLVADMIEKRYERS